MVVLAQIFFKLEVVFNDSVVHYHYSTGTIAMGVRILFGRPAVRCPASVSNSVGTVDRIQPDRFFKVSQFTFGPADFEIMFLVDNSYTSGVVTAIFKFAEAVDNQRHDLLVSDITNYSTHKSNR
jgi:hypothetical protein